MFRKATPDHAKTPSRKTRLRSVRGQSGLTLIEVAMAAAIIASGLMVYASFTGNFIDKRQSTSRESVAITLAQDKIEDIKNIAMTIRLDHGFSATLPARANPSYTSANGWQSLANEVLDGQGNAANSGMTYTRSWDVDPVGGASYLYDVTVNVTWDNGTNSVALETLIAQ